MLTEQEKIEIATIRLALIQPGFNNTYPDESKTAYYARIAEKPVKLPNGKEVKYSPGTLSCWESQYRKYGFEGLRPKNRDDAGKSRKLDDDTIAAIYRIHSEFPKINATEIYYKLIADGLIKASDVSLCTVQRYIKKHRIKGACSPNLKDRKAFEEEWACGMYQADTLYGPYIKEDGHNRRTYCIMIIDDKTRMIVGGKFFYNDNAYNFQKVLKSACATYGIPTKLYVDNGSPYKNYQLKEICGRIGTVLIHTAVRDGASKGKVERNFRTLRNRFLNVLNPDELTGIDDLNNRLNEYIRKHNTTVHSATGMEPATRYSLDVSMIKMPTSKEWLDDCFYNHVSRKVSNDATVRFDKTSYDVPMEFIGETVDIYYLPDDVSSAHIRHDSKRYDIKLTNKVENSKTKRNNDLTIRYGGIQ